MKGGDMTRKDALAELFAKVEAGDVLAVDLQNTLGIGIHQAVELKHNSLDAAISWISAVLPGWFPGVSENIYGHGWHGWVQTHERSVDANSDSPARALLLAGLRALHAQEQS